jgi:quercetin dioxygenase-like cupin family protein
VLLVAGEGSKIGAAHYIPAGRDRFRGQREIRLTRTVIDIKVSTLDTGGALSVAEVTFLHKGGPVRHLHHEQDEWFYVVEGEHVIEVEDERHELETGDSLLGPRNVAHAWAQVGEGGDRKDDRCLAARGRDRGVLRRSREGEQHPGARRNPEGIQFARPGASRTALVDRISISLEGYPEAVSK